MFKTKKKHEYLAKEYVWLWGALAFQAGYANAGGFLACARFVSHMTGFGTQVGISVSQRDYLLAFEMISAPISFLLGAMASALAVDRPMIYDRKPHYLLIVVGLVLIFTFVTIGGVFGVFGEFGEPLRYQRDFALMSLLCFACGMQNACFGSLTRGQIRTTHLTGILTDIGVTFIKLLHLEKRSRSFIILKRMNYVRILTFLSFSLGSAVSTIIVSKLGYAGFGVLIALSSALLASMIRREQVAQAPLP